MRNIDELEKAKSFGLLLTPYILDQMPDIVSKVETFIKNIDIKVYTISTNNLDQNVFDCYPEIDAYILLACPFALSKVDFKSFTRPAGNFFSLQMALNKDDFEFDISNYTLDLSFFRDGASLYTKGPPDISAKLPYETGQIVSNQFYNSLPIKKMGFTGYSQKLGETEVAEITEGLKGIASGYSHER